MINILINHIPSTALHLLTGSLIMYIFFSKKGFLLHERLKIISLGVIVLLPDLPKLAGGNLAHSLFALPWLSLLTAFYVRKITKESFQKSWFASLFTILFGAIFIDFIGNGVQLFFPLTSDIIEFTIIQKEIWLVCALFAVFSAALIFNHKPLLITSLLIISLLLVGKAISKVELENRLEAKYDDNQIHVIVTKPEKYLGLNWRFSVLTNEKVIQGTSPVFQKEITIKQIVEH
ncbi:hypothetical protein [Halobacillus naozhouensis]|uniref:LexA-binding, inner membrane-associated hydrolase n=1 Tax=Halobacillus naozhouensis TaxID=554880 RepID=A0ABY8IZG0_9BACI|nr:hypothetical protein [Halobacillus naozhouensis]WFT73895.1 hypothetical protein P9989_16190 [Halobacillus naozhouensis]